MSAPAATTAIAAVIFDCDGTLVDSEALGNAVLLELAVEHGIPLSAAEAIADFRGGRMADYIAQLEAIHGGPLPETFVPAFRSRARAAFATQLRPIPGAARLLAALSARGLPLAVASNGPREKTTANLASTGLLGYFPQHVFSAYEIGAWKPDPALYLHAARALGVAPARCAVVEDSLPGITAGLAAGMQVFAFLPDGWQAGIPSGTRYVRDLDALEALIGGA